MQGEEATSFQSLGALGPQNSISEALGVPLFWAMLEVSPAPTPLSPHSPRLAGNRLGECYRPWGIYSPATSASCALGCAWHLLRGEVADLPPWPQGATPHC